MCKLNSVFQTGFTLNEKRGVLWVIVQKYLENKIEVFKT